MKYLFRIKIFFFCLVFLLSSTVVGQELKEAYSNNFTGAFVEVSSRAGLVSANSGIDGKLIDVGIRQSFPMHLLDTRLAFRYELLNLPGSEEDLKIYGTEISTGFHPAYLALLFENWFAWVIASFYFELSVGLHHAVLQNEKDFGFSYSLGTGLDFPLWNPNHGWSIWINALYRYRRLDFDASDREIELHNHTAFLGLSIRWNRLLF